MNLVGLLNRPLALSRQAGLENSGVIQRDSAPLGPTFR
jgi:hypothetical protein